MTVLFLVAYYATPLACWLLNSFLVKRRVPKLELFIFTCIVGYLVLMLVFVSQVAQDAFERQSIDAGAVFGEGEGSDAGLALAPVLGVPVTIVWTAINFIAFTAIEWCYRTDFLSAFGRKTPPQHIVEDDLAESSEP